LSAKLKAVFHIQNAKLNDNHAIAGSVSVDIPVRNAPPNCCAEDGIDGYTPELITKLQLPDRRRAWW
jgi:hypothetical protein